VNNTFEKNKKDGIMTLLDILPLFWPEELRKIVKISVRLVDVRYVQTDGS
jgi:hypothetical protein